MNKNSDLSNNAPGFDPDFAKALQDANHTIPIRDLPPLHPRDDPTTISDEEMEEIVKAKQNRSIFGNTKFRCQYGIFDLNDIEQREALQNMIDNCLQKGWLLAKEEWHRTQDGRAIVAVKVLIPEARRKNKKNRKDSIVD